MFNIFIIILGVVIGWITSTIFRTNSTYSALANLLLGAAGTFNEGIILKFLGIKQLFEFDLNDFLTTAITLVLLFFLSKALKKI